MGNLGSVKTCSYSAVPSSQAVTMAMEKYCEVQELWEYDSESTEKGTFKNLTPSGHITHFSKEICTSRG